MSGGRGSWRRSVAPRLNVERGPGFLDDCDRLGLSRAQVAHIVRAVMIRAEADPHLEAVVLASIPSARGMSNAREWRWRGSATTSR